MGLVGARLGRAGSAWPEGPAGAGWGLLEGSLWSPGPFQWAAGC